jgi:hypothetical protein
MLSAVLLLCSLSVYAGDYDEHDLSKLKAYLVQASEYNTDWDGKTNGELFGLTAEEVSSLDANEEWVSKVRGVEWTSGSESTPKRIYRLGAEDERNMWVAIGAVDFSGCEELTVMGPELYIGEMTSLNVSGCTSLTELDSRLTPYDSPLTSIDASDCTSLTLLWNFTNDALATVNVSGCTSLTGLHVGGSGLHRESPLTSLDVSTCTSLTALVVHGNLTTLDLSNNPALTNLSISAPLISLTVGWTSAADFPSNIVGLRANTTLFVPVGCIPIYQSADYWNGFREILEIGSPLPELTLSVSPLSFEFGAVGGSELFAIESNVPWSISVDADWQPLLSATEAQTLSKSLSAEGNVPTVEFRSVASGEIHDFNGLTLNQSSGTGNANITLKVTANPLSTARTREITISSPTGASSRTLLITQAAPSVPDPEPPLIEYPDISLGDGDVVDPVIDLGWSSGLDAMYRDYIYIGDAENTITIVFHFPQVNVSGVDQPVELELGAEIVNEFEVPVGLRLPVGSSSLSVSLKLKGRSKLSTLSNSLRVYIEDPALRGVITARVPALDISASSMELKLYDRFSYLLEYASPGINYGGYLRLNLVGGSPALQMNINGRGWESAYPNGDYIEREYSGSELSDLSQVGSVIYLKDVNTGSSVTVIPVTTASIPVPPLYRTVTLHIPSGIAVESPSSSLVIHRGEYVFKLARPSDGVDSLLISLSSVGIPVVSIVPEITLVADTYHITISNITSNLDIHVSFLVTTGTPSITDNALFLQIHGTLLTVTSPSAEVLTLYSLSGSLLLQAEKEKGSTTIAIGHLPKGVLIVRGSSGWTRKIFR